MLNKTKLVVGVFGVIIVAIQFSLFGGNYSGGDGLTAETAFIIADLDDLQELQNTSGDWDAFFKQTNDIDASPTSGWDSNSGFSPIGDPLEYFTGSYNGQGYTIDGLYINRPSSSILGMFGWAVGADIKNIIITNLDYTGSQNIGGIVGMTGNSNVVDNCYTSGTISAPSPTGGGYIGGIVGWNSNSTVSNCHTSGSFTCGYRDAGGIAGINHTSTITRCSSSATTSSGGNWAGGIAGRNYNSSTISCCFATGTATADFEVGGLVGLNTLSSTISNSYATGNVNAVDTGGGLVGWNYSSSQILNCYSTGSVSGSASIGGLVGATNCTVSHSFWNIVTSGQVSSAGGIGKNTTQMTTDALVYNYTTNIYLNDGWDFKGETINGTDDIWNIGNSRNNGYPYLDWEYPSDPATLPVVLSTFTAQFIENTPTVHWSTQSETDNMGWFVYRNSENEFSTSEVISNLIEGYGTTTQQQFYTYEDDIEDPEVGETYYYWLESVDYSGMIHHYDNVAILAIPDDGNSGNSGITTPERFGLFRNEPNPVISSTRISFNLIEIAKVDLAIYNLKGQLVKKLYSGVTSKHTIMWDGKDEQGKELENGVYFYKLIVNGNIKEVKKLIMLK